MSNTRLDTEFRLVPKPDISLPTVSDGSLGSELAEIADGYKPWESVTAKIIPTKAGGVLEVVDGYLPPVQREGGELLDGGKSVYIADYTTVGYDIAAPSSVLFTDGNSRKKFTEIDRIWLRRMGVKETNYYFRPWLKMEDETLFSFEGVNYDSGVSQPYGAFSKKDLTEMGYACTLLSHHMGIFFRQMRNGDHIWVKVEVGKGIKETNLFAVRKIEKSNYHVLTITKDLVPILVTDLEPMKSRGYIPSLSIKKEEASRQKKYLNGDFSSRFGIHEAIRAVEFLSGIRADKIYTELPSVVVKFANSMDSYGAYIPKE